MMLMLMLRKKSSLKILALNTSLVPLLRNRTNTCHHSHTHSSPLLLLQEPSGYMSIRKGDKMGAAMNELNSVLMFISEITSQEAAYRREKQMEEEELKAKAASQSKVVEWMKTTTTSGL
jgi:hypothetical protein